MSDDAEALLRLIERDNDRVLHYQDQRTNTTNVIFVVAGAIAGAIAIDNKVCGPYDLILAGILAAAGILGVWLNTKYHERINYHEVRYEALISRLNEILPNATIGKIIENSDRKAQEHSRVRRFFSKRTLWRAWVLANLIAVVLGVALAFVASRNMACA